MAIKDFKANLWFQAPFAENQAELNEDDLQDQITKALAPLGIVVQGNVVFCTGWAPEPNLPAML